MLVLLRIVGFSLVLGLVPLSADAQVFMYEDANGRLHFSDTPRHEGYRTLVPSASKSVRPVSTRSRRPRGPVATRAWDGVIARAGRQFGVKPGLVKAIVHTESLFDLYAVSHKGAQGLMQLMPRTARSLGVTDPFDPWQNIEGGTKYIGYLMRRFDGNVELALAAYNAGETVVRRYEGIPPYRETQRYVKRVMTLSRRYDADFR
jgi:soluble lytic murein transglycosylase-like protein